MREIRLLLALLCCAFATLSFAAGLIYCLFGSILLDPMLHWPGSGILPHGKEARILVPVAILGSGVVFLLVAAALKPDSQDEESNELTPSPKKADPSRPKPIIKCHNCNKVIPEQEVLDGWCEACGKKIPEAEQSRFRKR